MSFIAHTSPPPATVETPIANDGFFPSVDLVKLREASRLNGTVTTERLRQACFAAITSVNAELATFKLRQEAAGHSTLAAVPATQLAGESVLLHHYRRAIYSAVQADLAESFRDFDLTAEGDKLAEQLEAGINAHRRNMRWAISDLLGIRRSTVELI